jgi:DNA-binding SARP family transcriptional activator
MDSRPTQWLAEVSGTGKRGIMEGTIWRRQSRWSTVVQGAEGASLTSLSLLSAFELACDGDPVSLPVPAQRLLAFVALQERPVLRTYVAETLWLDSTQEHACGSLRSALWRLGRSGHELVQVSGQRLRLEPEVGVDVRRLVSWAHGVLDAPEGIGGELAGVAGIGDAGVGELLPDWYDDWLVVERERLRELRARALERLCQRLTASRSLGAAIEAGLAAARAEPLRESAHRCLIGVYLAEGNQAEALQEYRLYRDLLHDQLGLAPSAQMEALVCGLLGR